MTTARRLNLGRSHHQLGPRLKVVAIIDPSFETANKVLIRKRGSFVVSAYADTRICSSLEDFVTTMKAHERPHAFIVGSPPAFRGSVQQGKDIELQILKAFPEKTPAVRSSLLMAVGLGGGVEADGDGDDEQLFIEKPISTDTVESSLQVGRMLLDSKTVVSVGYFLRYLKGTYAFAR